MHITIDQTTVASDATLIVANGVTLTVANGEGVDLTVTGTLTNSGTITCNSGSTVLYNGGNQTVLPLDYHELSFTGSTDGSTKTFADGTTKVGTQISLTDNITLTGSSKDNVTVQVTTPYNWDGTSGNESATVSRVFYVDANGKAVNIENMTIRGGDISSIEAAYGGSIILYQGNLNISRCLITGSKADSGGGLQLAGSGTLTLDESTVQYCTTSVGQYGGGIRLGGGSNAILTLTNSTVAHNHSDNFGGGVSSGASTTVNIINCTISDNTSNGNGGGISSAAVLNLVSSTVANNHANNDNDGTQKGGGLFVNAGTPTVKNTILTDNYWGSETTTGDDYYYKTGALTDNGYNIVKYQGGGVPTGAGKTFTAATDYIYTGSGNDWTHDSGNVSGTIDLASTLADNGGPTETLAITSSKSIAVGNGNTDATTDQRGATRKSPPTIGAYEYVADYRTKGAGDWSTLTNWEVSSGFSTWEGAGTYPDDDNFTSITVQHNMNVDANVAIDRTSVEAVTLTINSEKTLTVADNTDTDLTIEGNLSNAGTLNCTEGSTVVFSGSTDSTLTSNGTTIFKTLTLNKTASPTALNIAGSADVKVETGLTVTNGTMNLSGWTGNLLQGGALSIDTDGRWIKHGSNDNYIQFYGNACTLNDASNPGPQDLGFIRVEELP